MPRPDYTYIDDIVDDLRICEAILARTDVQWNGLRNSATRSGLPSAGTGHRYSTSGLRKSKRPRGVWSPKPDLPAGCRRGTAPAIPGPSRVILTGRLANEAAGDRRTGDLLSIATTAS